MWNVMSAPGISTSLTPNLVRTVQKVDFNVGAGPILANMPDIPSNNLAIRYDGKIKAIHTGAPQDYTIYVTADDVASIRIANARVFVLNSGASPRSGSFILSLDPAVPLDISIEFWEGNGGALLKLEWESIGAGVSRQVIKDSAFSVATAACGWTPGDLDGGQCGGLTAQYYFNFLTQSFADATPDLVVKVPRIDWRGNEPVGSEAAPGFPQTNYGARYVGRLRPFHASGDLLYNFYITSDDGVRVKINGQTVVESWIGRGATTDLFPLTMRAGTLYDIVIEYFQGTGGASLRFEWEIPGRLIRSIVPVAYLSAADTACGWVPPPVPPCQGLTASYYTNFALRSFDGRVPVRILPRNEINFIANESPLLPDVPESADNVGIRYDGKLVPSVSGQYTFFVTSDNGVRIRVNGETVLDRWTAGTSSGVSFSLTLSQGAEYIFVLEYFEGTLGARLKLEWQPPSGSRQVVPQTAFSPASGECGWRPPPGFCDGLSAKYYFNFDTSSSFGGVADFVGYRSTINIGSGSNQPLVGGVPGFPVDRVGAIFNGFLVAPNTGPTTAAPPAAIQIRVTYTDAVRVRIGQTSYVQDWTVSASARVAEFAAPLESDSIYPIVIEYADVAASAALKLEWKLPGQADFVVISAANLIQDTQLCVPAPKPLRPILSCDSARCQMIGRNAQCSVAFGWVNPNPVAISQPQDSARNFLSGLNTAGVALPTSFAANGREVYAVSVPVACTECSNRVSWQLQGSSVSAGPCDGTPAYDTEDQECVSATFDPRSCAVTPRTLCQGFYAEYYDNELMLGEPLFTRVDPRPRFDTNNLAPTRALPAAWSLRWSGCIKNPTHDESDADLSIRISNLDDFVRVWADGRLMINSFTNGDDRSFAIKIARGQCYPLTIEYRNIGGPFSMAVQWLQTSPVPPAGTEFQIIPKKFLVPTHCTAPERSVCTGLSGRYFPDRFVNVAGHTRTDNQISFDWSPSTPIVPSNNFPSSDFAVSWRGFLTPPNTRAFRFTVAVKPGTTVSMKINGDPVIANSQPVKDFILEAGRWYPVEIDLTQDGFANPYVGLFWQSTGDAGALPTLIPALQFRTSPDCQPVSDPIPTCSGLYTDFYRGQFLVGEPLSTTIETSADLNWPAAPNPVVPADDFSARFSACLRNPATDSRSQQVTMFIKSSNRLRFWVGSDLKNEAVGEYSVAFEIPAGRCAPFSVEMRHASGLADLKLEWSFTSARGRVIPRSVIPVGLLEPTSCTVDTQRSCRGLVGQYYSGNQEFIGNSLTRIDSAIQMAWSDSDEILPGLATRAEFPNAPFSIIWKGWLMPKHASGTETYSFWMFSDDRSSVWVDGVNVVADWGSGHGPTRVGGSAFVSLTAGKPVPITIWHSQVSGLAVAGLSWEIVGKTERELVPSHKLQRTVDCSPVPEVPACSGLYAEYYQSHWFQGLPFTAVATATPNMVFNTPLANPGGSPISSFAARFTGCIQNPSPTNSPQAVSVEFRLRSPSPTVVWMGLRQPIDSWSGATDQTWTIELPPNSCTPISIDYRQDGGSSTLQLTWKYRLNNGFVQPPEPISREFLKPTRCAVDENRSCRGVRGEYFPDRSISTGSSLARDNQLSFVYPDGRSSVDVPAFPHNDFQINFRTYLVPDISGDYRFYSWADDGIRLKITGPSVNSLVIDSWTISAPALRGPSPPVTLQAGTAYLMEVEFFGWVGSEILGVLWELPGQIAPSLIPIHNMRQSPNCDGNTLEPPVPACAGLYGEYFDNLNLFGQPIATSRDVDASSKTWPAGSVSNGPWAVRYAGCIANPRADTNPLPATVRIRSTGSVQLWIGMELRFMDGNAPGQDLDFGLLIPGGGQCLPITIVSRQSSLGAHSFSLSWYYNRQGPSSLEIIPPKFLKASLCTPLSLDERQCSGLWGRFFRNPNFVGDFVSAKTSPVFLASRTPDPVLPAPNADFPRAFSAVWHGVLVPLPGVKNYRFWAGYDDSVRVWVNGERVVDDWTTGGYRVSTSGATLALDGSRPYSIRIDYRTFGGDSHLNLGWEIMGESAPGPIPVHNLKLDASCQLVDRPPQPPTCSGVYAEYFANQYLSGLPSNIQIEPSINIDWTGRFPQPAGIPFTARFTGCLVNPTTGTPSQQPLDVTLRFTTAHGFRFWVGVDMVLDRWRMDSSDISVTARLPADRCQPFVLEKLFLGDPPSISVQWSYQVGSVVTPSIPILQQDLRPSRCSPDPDSSCSGLRAEYHPDYRTHGHPLVMRDSILNFFWPDSQPNIDPSFANGLGNSFPRNGWGVTWRGVIRPLHEQAGVAKTYKFVVRAVFGVRVIVDGRSLFGPDQFAANYLRTLTSDPVVLTGGNWYQLEIEHFHRAWDSQFSLGWFIEGETEIAVVSSHFLRVSSPQNGLACGAEILPTQPSCSGLFGEYFLGQNLLGLPEHSSIDPVMDISFVASPFPSLPDRTSDWSARWSGCILSPFHVEGDYLPVDLIVRADAGARVWVGGMLQIEDTTGPVSIRVTLYPRQLATNCVPITIEYRKSAAQGRIQLSWTFERLGINVVDQIIPQTFLKSTFCTIPNRAEARCNGLLGEYYSNRDLRGFPRTRTDYSMTLHWPAAPVVFPGGEPFPPYDWSASWVGFVKPMHTTGTKNYVFSITADDAVRVWLDGVLIVDQQQLGAGRRTFNYIMSIDATRLYPIQVHFVQGGGHATLALGWAIHQETLISLIPSQYLFYSRDCTPPPPIPACSGLYYELYDNQGMIGRPVLTGFDAAAQVDYNTLAPFSPGQRDNWSGRWSGCIVNPSPANARQPVTVSLRFISTDGLKVWLRGASVVDSYTADSVDTTVSNIVLSLDRCTPITIAFRQTNGPAAWRIEWTYTISGINSVSNTIISRAYLRPSQCVADTQEQLSCSGLRGQYFRNERRDGVPTEYVDSPMIRLWESTRVTVPPALTGLPASNIAVSWRGFLLPAHESGDKRYRFSTWSNDGARLFLSGSTIPAGQATLIDNWNMFAGLSVSDWRTLRAGELYAIQVDWFDGSNGGEIVLSWEIEGETEASVIPSKNLRPDATCPAAPVPACSGAFAEYFSNMEMYGLPALSTVEPVVSGDYSVRAPFDSVPLLDWSARHQFCIRNPRPSGDTPTTLHFHVNERIKIWIRDDIIYDGYASVLDFGVTIPSGRCLPIVTQFRRSFYGGSFSVRWTVEVPERAVVFNRQTIPEEYLESPVCSNTDITSRECRGLKVEHYSDPRALVAPLVSSSSALSFRLEDSELVAPPSVSGLTFHNFAAIYRGFLRPKHTQPGAQTYLLAAFCDDICTLKIDGQILWNKVGGKQRSLFSMDSARVYEVEFFYEDFGYLAQLQLLWALPNEEISVIPSMFLQRSRDLCGPSIDIPNPPCTGLYAEYFPNPRLAGTPDLIRIEPGINWNRETAPRPVGRYWSARFSGCIQNPYDDGRPLDIHLFGTGLSAHRLWVGANIGWTNWAGNSNQEQVVAATIPGAQCLPIVLEYRSDAGISSEMTLKWRFNRSPLTAGQVLEVIPTRYLKPTRCEPESIETRTCKGLVGQFYSDHQQLDLFTTFVHNSMSHNAVEDLRFPNEPENADPITTKLFSGVWKGFLTPGHESGVQSYVFHAWADDVIRVWVDGVLVVTGGASVGPNAAVNLDASRVYPILVVGLNSPGPVRFSVAWSWASRPVQIIPTFNLRQTQDCSPIPPVPPCSGMYVEAWKDTEYMEGMPADSFVVPTISFNWKTVTTANAQSDARFSTRISGCILNPAPQSSPQDVSVTLHFISSSPIRVWIRDSLVMNNWGASFADETRTVVFGPSKCVPIVIETRNTYRFVQLRWSFTLNTPTGRQYGLDEIIPQRFLKPTRCTSYFASAEESRARECKGLRADYFADRFAPVSPYSITTSQINYAWEDPLPVVDTSRALNHPIISSRNFFAVRWTGYVLPKHDAGTKNYIFRFRGDDQIRARFVIGGQSEYLVGSSTEWISMGNAPVDGRRSIPLTTGTPVFIEIEFAAWDGLEDVLVAWKLEGVDEDWEIIPLHNFQTSANCDGSLPPPPSAPCGGLYGEVTGGDSFGGAPVRSTVELATLASGEPITSIPAGTSVRWTGCIGNPDIRGAVTTVWLYFDYDEAIQAWVGSDLVISAAGGGSSQIGVILTDSRCVPMTIKMRNSFDNPRLKIRYSFSSSRGVAFPIAPIDGFVLKASRCSPDPQATCKGLNGRLWTNYAVSSPVPEDSPPAVTFTSRALTFYKTEPTPLILPNFGINLYVVRWTGFLIPMHNSGSATYRIGALVDDAVRVRIRDTKDLVLNDWANNPTHQSPTFDVVLTAGQPMPIEIDYYDLGGGATFNFHWEQLDNNPTRRVGPIPPHYFLASNACIPEP